MMELPHSIFTEIRFKSLEEKIQIDKLLFRNLYNFFKKFNIFDRKHNDILIIMLTITENAIVFEQLLI